MDQKLAQEVDSIILLEEKRRDEKVRNSISLLKKKLNAKNTHRLMCHNCTKTFHKRRACY
jgi:hypothetical protein